MKINFNRRKASMGHQTLKDASDVNYGLDRTPSLERSDGSSQASRDSTTWEIFDSPSRSSLDWPDLKTRKEEGQDATEVRRVLKQTGVIKTVSRSRSCSETTTPTPSSKEEPAREPLWKRRSRSAKVPFDQNIPFDEGFAVVNKKPIHEHAPDLDEAKNPEDSLSPSSQSEVIYKLSKNTSTDDESSCIDSKSTEGKVTITKSVSFDESSLVPSRSSSPGLLRKQPAKHGRSRSQEHLDRHKIAGIIPAEPSPPDNDLMTALQRAGSNFSEIFQDLAPEEVDDLFSVDTPSYLSRVDTGDSYDDDTRTSMSSYSRRRRDDSTEYGDDEGGCASTAKDFDGSAILNALGVCQGSTTITDDLKVFGEILMKEASCYDCSGGDSSGEATNSETEKRRK